jgi:hypothetical protein
LTDDQLANSPADRCAGVVHDVSVHPGDRGRRRRKA